MKFNSHKINFELPEDQQYFADILTNGDTENLDKNFHQFFDFRAPNIKRNEFNATKSSIKRLLIDKYGGQCILQISPKCSKNIELVIDHLIPLSSNKLNKKLHHMAHDIGKKVQTQSFGSNNDINLILACKKCNALKMNKLPDAYPIVRKLIIERAANITGE